MQHLEGSGTPVLYMGPWFLNVNTDLCVSIHCRCSSFCCSWSQSDIPHSVRLPSTSDQPIAETSTWQHTALTGFKHPCQRRNSNPQSQEASGRRTTPLTAQPPGSAHIKELF